MFTPTRLATSASSWAGITDSIISFAKTGSMTLSATATEDVLTRATGAIVIFNNYSTAPQKLVVNTRFANSNGLIYRIAQSVVVPGKTTKNGKTTPGSVRRQSLPTKLEHKYNIPFPISLFLDLGSEPQYDGFFARSDTPMTGGFSGTRPVYWESLGRKRKVPFAAHLASDVIAKQAHLCPPVLFYIRKPFALITFLYPTLFPGTK